MHFITAKGIIQKISQVPTRFIKEDNKFHPTIKFTAEISDNQIFSWNNSFQQRATHRKIYLGHQNPL